MENKNIKVIYLAGGCFWGLQKYLNEIPGIVKTEVGYANGHTDNPTYEDVCYKNTSHAETVRVEYDPALISLQRILTLYYQVINPTALNRQGNDVGSQYRTGIYFVDPIDQPDSTSKENQMDEAVIRASIAELQKKYEKPIAIEVKPLINYFPAEGYHQNYLDKNPGGYCHIPPRYFDKAKKAIVDPYNYEALSKESLREILTPLQYDVTMNDATEPPYQNEFWDRFEEGIYVDITSGEPLFSSRDKFGACGWPSFTKPIDPEVITNKLDKSHGMIREEVRSRVGDAHLGHVFNDGPIDKGGLRYCINSASLRFIPKDKMEAEGYGKYFHFL